MNYKCVKKMHKNCGMFKCWSVVITWLDLMVLVSLGEHLLHGVVLCKKKALICTGNKNNTVKLTHKYTH